MKVLCISLILFVGGGGLNNELSDMKSSDCNRLDDFEIFII